MKSFKGMKLLTGLMSVMLIIVFGATKVMAANASVPNKVSYQAELAGDAASASSVGITFTFYDAEGAKKWCEFQEIDVINGVVSTDLGSVIDITKDKLDGVTQLGIIIDNGAEIRSELTSSLFAIRASVADSLAEHAIMLTEGNIGLVGDFVDGEDNIIDDSIKTSSIADGAVTSQKTKVSIVTKTPANGEEPIELTQNDQGLVLVSGRTIIKLPSPVPAGQKYTIKKTDEGLQRKGGESSEPCEPRSNYVTVRAGDGTIDWFTPEGKFKKNNKLIENRTNSITLEYKNAYATFISDGTIWYITDSNPLIDIFNPVPGGLGEIESPDNLAEGEIPLTLYPATDCDECACDTCDNKLYYLPIFSTDNDHKLITTADALENGYRCANDWEEVTETVNAFVLKCDPRNYGYTPGEVKMNVMIRDESNNLSVYNPPGDIDPPELAEGTDEPVLTRDGTDDADLYIYVRWATPDDNVSDKLNIQYKIDLSANGETLNALAYQSISDSYDPFRPEKAGYLNAQYTENAVRIYQAGGNNLVDGTTYTIKLYAKDEAGNEFEYEPLTITPHLAP